MELETLLQRIADSLEKIAEVSTTKPCKYTLFEWLEEWFATYRAPVLEDGGYDLRHTLDKHVLSNIENKPLNDYSSHDIVGALSKVASERMRQITRQIYDQSFREAVRAGYIERNPVDNVDNVKHEYENGRALTRPEQAEFLNAIKFDNRRFLYIFHLLTGARPSEPLAVTWKHIGSDTVRIPGTKTKLSDRIIPISRDLRELLDEIPHDGERLFPYTYQAIRVYFNRHIRPNLSFEMTIKDLRHTFATRCAEAGVNMRTLQKWLGHSKIETTAKYYTHILTEFERAEIKRLNVYPTIDNDD